ncbi:transcription factor SPT20 homolog [Drosophila novamexicana]|uniref:transcription factor SPT20 homolog n=1 Tax=Drosophila novamexicana TaxID=47314 RepID=UPI0011E5F0F0|nr:transcription factor SPT20 homolog [Drosophila novamexicana]
MKIFVTILVAALALARADISLTQQGYNYRQQQQQQQQPTVVAHLLNQQLQQQQQQQQSQSSHPVLPPLAVPLPYLPPAGQYQPQQQRPIAAAFPMPANFPVNFQTAPLTQTRRSRPRVRIPKKPIVTKNFFIHTAPEESDDEIQDELQQLNQQPRNHYNVLFVKTPAQTNRAAALNLAKTLKQEKTVVYVLAKKTTAADLQDAIAEAPQHINKPEVFFIKYRTPEEALNAQRQIQTQYDALGGSSTITDEGLAPITSVVGSLDAPEEEEEEQQQQQQAIEGNGNLNVNAPINNQYLPSNQF